MKKFNKYISLAVAGFLGASMATSCDNSKDNDFVQEYEGPSGVYFSSSANAYLELSEDQSTVTFPVYRDVAGSELTVAVNVYPVDDYEDDIFTFPSSVTFAAGSKVADYVIGYDISKIEMGEEQEYELVLDAESTPFASNNVVITLANPAPWTLIGTTGQYYDYGWGISMESTGPAIVSVWQGGLDKNLYRISNPYIAFNGDENSYFQFRVLQQGQVFLDTPVTQPDLVGFTLYYIMYDSDEQDDVYLGFPGIFFDDISTWTNNRVLEYQEDGLPGLIQIAPLYYLYNSGGAYNYPALDPYVYIYFPGYVSLDTDIMVTYEGILTPSTQQQQVLLTVELGADLTSVRAAVGAGKDADSIAKAIDEGSIDYVEVDNSGSLKIPFGNNNETGDYTAVLVGYVDGEMKATASASFFYISSSTEYDPNEGWTSLGYVDYTDAYVCANIFLESPIQTYSLEIQQSNDDPGLYRLVNPYGEPYPYNYEGDYNAFVDSYLYFNMSDPSRVYILQSEQTLDWGEYGAMNYVWSMANYFQINGSGGEAVSDDQIAAAGYFGSYADGKVTFPESYIEDGDMYSTLSAYWTYADEPQYTGLVYANAVLDYDQYVASNYTEPYMYAKDGSLYNPFCIDMSSLTQTANYRQNGHVMLTSKSSLPPRPTTLNKLQKVKNPSLPKVEKDVIQKAKKNPTSIQRKNR